MPAGKVFLHPFDSFGLPTMTATFQSWVWPCLLVLKPNFKGENITVLKILLFPAVSPTAAHLRPFLLNKIMCPFLP